MTTVVQSVAANGLAGTSAKVFTVASTTAGNLVVIECAVEGGSTLYTGFTVTDNGSGNTWSSAVSKTAADNRIAAVLYCLSISAGVTSITVTGTGGSGGMFGAMSVQEISGGTWSLDKTGNGTIASGTVTVTNSGANVGTTNFVAAALSTGNGATNCAITDPPTGYTSAAVMQNDSADAGGECCYRIDSSAVTDSVTWSATSFVNADPAVLASFKTAGSTALTDQSATFTAGTVARSTTVSLIGQSATFAAGTVTAQGTGTVQLTGQSATLTAGALAPSLTIALTGQAATFSSGTVTASTQTPGAALAQRFDLFPIRGPLNQNQFRPRPAAYSSATNSVTVGLTGQSAGFSLGTVGPSSSVPAAGALISSSVGSVLAASQIVVTGQSAATSAGAIVPSAQLALTGQSSTFSSGAVVPGLQVTLVGQASTFASGTLALGSTVVLTGQSASFTAGNLVASGGGNVTLALTGQSAAFTAGALLPSSSVALTGQAITSAAGVIAPARSLAFTGQSATFAAGNLLPSSAVGVTGQSATFAAGNVTAPNGVTLALTGQAASFTAGSTTPSMTVGLTGQSITSSAGTLAAANAHALAGSAITSASGTLLGSFAVALAGQQSILASGLVLPPSDKTASLTGSIAAFHAGTVLGIGAILTGTPRYVVRRQQKRIFTVSAVSYSQFPPKDTAEAVKLEFDFSPDLDSGLLLSGTPVVTVTMSSGADPTPTSILNGLPRFDVTSTQVIVPVVGGVANCDYDVKVVVPTTDSLTVLALSGILPVRA